MTPEKTERIIDLQRKGSKQGGLLPLDQAELDALRRELALEVETADDPATLFTDESRRPLTTGGDSLQRFKDEDWADALAHAEAFALKFGVALAKAALESVLKGR